MGQPFDRTPHTLAQLARRAGISEGRARALFAASPSGLPRPDRTDADGRPLWWASTIDAWCARTGREVSSDSLWLFRVSAVAGPVPELFRGVEPLSRYARPQSFYVIVWDTDHGHVVYLQPLGGTGGDHKDWLAVHAAEVIEPRWWADAVVVMPLARDLNFFPDLDTVPRADVYRLTTRPTEDDSVVTVGRIAGVDDDGGGVFGGLRRWLSRAAPDTPGPARPKAQWAGLVDVADIASVVGWPVPVWMDDTDTTSNAEQTLSYDRTFTTTDTVTEWPAAQARLERALEVNLPGEYPAGFAALAVDAADGLAKIRAAHDRTSSAGDGWYLVCRPARLAPSIELEQRITGACLVADVDLVGKELTELRAVAGELDVDDPRGEVYAETIELLEWQLRRAAKHAGQIRDVGHDYVPVADDGLLPYSAPWVGPVVDAWRKTLTPVDDLAAVLRLRRVRRILRTYPLDAVRRAFRDREGRYVLVIHRNGGEWSLAEWPVSLAATRKWTDRTVLAGDEHGSVTTLMALTPTDDGVMRIDPVPLTPRSDRDAFAYGYGGGTPGTTYRALLRCALDDEPGCLRVASLAGEHHPDGTPVSQLWEAISTTTGPLRLSWPQLKLWARADRKTADCNDNPDDE
ncbi:MAG: hypothetical protein ACRDSP_26305 [Pseudonocardiaceae bacterium]